MAQAGYTPIVIYHSTTAAAAPTNTNLANGELAINIADGKLFYKDDLNAVQVIGWKTVPASAGGTGNTTYTNGQLLIGNSTGNTLTKATLTAGSGVSITNGSGSITIAATGLGGDVVGPASSTDNAFARFDSTTGKIIQNSIGATLDDAGAPTFTSVVTVAGTSSGGAAIRLAEDTDNGTNYVGLAAPANIGSNLTFVLPAADGTNGQALTTDGSGTLSFTTITGGATKGQAIAFALIFG